jgi:hypothetical protein
VTVSTISLTDCPPRFATRRRHERRTFGGAVAQIATTLGTPLDPWQRFVADVALEVDDEGRLCYRDVTFTVPRQSGKSTLILPVMVHRAIAFAERQKITYTAQTRNDARKKWIEEYLYRLQRSPFKTKFQTRLANGGESILWDNGSMQDLLATRRDSGHGFTLDLGVVDEAFALYDDRVEQAMKPAMVTRPQAQMWVTSTAGDAQSAWLWSKIEQGREAAQADVGHGTAFFEWSAGDDDDPDDEATWRRCMPALGARVSVETIRSERLSMPDPSFRRAYLNQWPVARHESVFAEADWLKCQDGLSQPSGLLGFAIDMPPDRSSAAVGVCGLNAAGRLHGEVVERRDGSAWVADRVAELASRWSSPVAVDPVGPASSLIEPLRQRGVDVIVVGLREHAQAAGFLFDAVRNGEFAHIGQPVLSEAVLSARQRQVGDVWLWARGKGGVDVSPLVAVTLAARAFQVASRGGVETVADPLSQIF